MIFLVKNKGHDLNNIPKKAINTINLKILNKKSLIFNHKSF